jgi:hypothetical protein
MKRVVQFTCIEAARLLSFCRVIDDFSLIAELSEVAYHNLLFVIEQDCDDVLREVIEEAVEPLADHVVFLLFVTCAMGAFKVVDIVYN